MMPVGLNQTRIYTTVRSYRTRLSTLRQSRTKGQEQLKMGTAKNSVPRFNSPAGFNLSTEMVDTYSRDGVLVLEDMFSDSECDTLIGRAAKLVESYDPSQARTTFSTKNSTHYDDENFTTSGYRINFFLEEGASDNIQLLNKDKVKYISKIGHCLHDLDPVFDQFSRDPRLEAVALSLGCKKPLLTQSSYIYKQPGAGGEFLWHQDSTYLMTEPMSCFGLWIALEDANIANGCLWVLPKHHNEPIRKRLHYVGDKLKTAIINSTPWSDTGSIPLEVERGTLIVLHGSLPHKSDTNRAKDSRQTYVLHITDGLSIYNESNWLKRPNDMPLRGFQN